MAWDSCRQEVESGGDKMCDVSLCEASQAGVDRLCHTKRWPAGTPFGIYVGNPPVLCFCCCSCFRYGTPIEATAGEFRAIEDFIPNDPIRAASVTGTQGGVQLQWADQAVVLSSGLEPDPVGGPMILVRYDIDGVAQELVVTDDQPFLLQDSGRIVPGAALQPGDRLTRADGAAAPVLDAHPVWNTSGVHHVSTNAPEGGIAGHLINSNGVVTGDITVKLDALTRQLGAGVLVDDLDERPKVGSPEYEQSYDDEALRYRTEPTRWPEGVTIVHRTSIFNLPPHARSFFSAEEAKLLQDADTPRYDIDSAGTVTRVRNLFKLFEAYYPDATYVLDWGNDVPNGYALSSYEQDFVVVTGGLARIVLLRNQGLSVVISHLLARLYGGTETGHGIRCVGPADYEGIANYFGGLYVPIQFPQQFPQAIEQMSNLFALLPVARPGDRCDEVDPACRIETYLAAAAIGDLPPCADPAAKDFRLQSATLTKQILVVEFSEDVDEATATSADNYTLSSGTITSAHMLPDDATKVVLLGRIERKTPNVLSATAVLSAEGRPLDPDPSRVTIDLGAASRS